MKVEVGKRLLSCRKAVNLTQKQVAEKLGVAQPVYQRFEKGVYQCSYEELVMLADIFDVTTDYLLGRTEY